MMATSPSNLSQFQCTFLRNQSPSPSTIFAFFTYPGIHFKTCFMRRCIQVIVTCPSNFSQFQCTVFKKLTSVIFNHFQFFSISVHPLTTIFLWEVHNNDRSMLKSFMSIQSIVWELWRKQVVVLQKSSISSMRVQIRRMKQTSATYIQPEDTCTRKIATHQIAKSIQHKGSRHATMEYEHAAAKRTKQHVDLQVSA